jgi:quercetin dioxygenase-like cupin family protein
MITIKTLKHALALLLILPVTYTYSQNTAAAENTALKRTVLLENKVELTSKRLTAKTIRVIFPPAFKTPLHTHEGPGPRYVIKGKLKVIEGGNTAIYNAGDVFWESGEVMSVENLSGQPAEMIIVELVPAIQ